MGESRGGGKVGQQCLGQEARAEREEERIVRSGAFQGDEIEETGTCATSLYTAEAGENLTITAFEWFTLCREGADTRVHRLGSKSGRSKRRSRPQQSRSASFCCYCGGVPYTNNAA